jgi:hypothetical protein
MEEQLEFDFNPPMPKLALETKLTARFVSMTPLTPAGQASLNAMNIHAEECAQRLQAAFRLLITEMLDMKHDFYAQEAQYAGFVKTDVPPNDRTDC